MQNILYHTSAIFGILAMTFIAATLLISSVYTQDSPATLAATGNATSTSESTSEEIGLSITIFSKATNTDYIYPDINSEQELVNALDEVNRLTHPESASLSVGAEEAVFTDQSNQQLASEIFTVASLASNSTNNGGSDSEDETSGSLEVLSEGFFTDDSPCKIAKYLKYVTNPCSSLSKLKDMIIIAEKKNLTALFL